MECDPGFRGSYLYIYLNGTGIMVLCEVMIGVSKYYGWYHLTMWSNSLHHASLTHYISNYLNIFGVYIPFHNKDPQR